MGRGEPDMRQEVLGCSRCRVWRVWGSVSGLHGLVYDSAGAATFAMLPLVLFLLMLLFSYPTHCLPDLCTGDDHSEDPTCFEWAQQA